MFIVIKEEGKLLTMKKQEKNKGITLIVLIIKRKRNEKAKI